MSFKIAFNSQTTQKLYLNINSRSESFGGIHVKIGCWVRDAGMLDDSFKVSL